MINFPPLEVEVTPLFSAIHDTYEESCEKFSLHKDDKDFSEVIAGISAESDGFLMLAKCMTGVGKTYYCNLLIFLHVHRYAKAASVYLNEILKIAKEIAIYAKDLRKRSGTEKISRRIIRLIDKDCITAKSGSIRIEIDNLVKECSHLINRLNEVGCTTKEADEISTFLVKLNDAVNDTAWMKDFELVAFINDTRDNISSTYNDLITLINSNKTLSDPCKSIMKSMIVRIHGNSDQLSVVDTDGDEEKGVSACHYLDDILHFIKSNEVSSEVKFGIQLAYDNYMVSKDEKERARDKKARKISGDKFRQCASDLYHQLYASCRRMYDLYRAGQVDIPLEVQAKIFNLMPASKLQNGDAIACFMTTAKYLTSISGIDGHFRMTDKQWQKHTLIIDEFDRQNSVIANELIKGDAYKLIRGLNTAMPSNITNFHQEKGDFAGVSDIMKPAIDTVQEINEKWCMKYPFDIQGGRNNRHRIEMFASRGSISVMVAGHYDETVNLSLFDEKSAKDEDVRKNFLAIEELSVKREKALPGEEKSADDDSGKFPHIVHDMNNAYRKFLACSSGAIYKIFDNKKASYEKTLKQYLDQKGRELKPEEEKVRPPKQPDLMSSLYDYIGQYNLFDIENDIKQHVFHKHHAVKSLTGESSIIRNGFHNKGFSLTKVDRELRDNSVDFETFRVRHSATGWLINIVRKGAKVVGVSATADCRSQIHNFSYDTLSEELGKRLVEFTDKQVNDIYRFYRNKRNYEAKGVSVSADFIKYDTIEITQHFESDGVLNVQLNNAFPAPPLMKTELEKKKYHDNILHQLGPMMTAIKRFVAHPTNRYMLVLSTRNFGKTKEEEAFLNTCIEDYSRKYDVKIVPRYAMDAEKMKSGAFSRLLAEIGRPENCHKKYIVFSSYGSMGAGKNPDYKVYAEEESKSRLVFVDDSGFRPPKISADADCIFMAMPTNVFAINDDGNDTGSYDYPNPKFKRSCLYNITALYAGGVIDAKTAKKFSRYVLSGTSKNIIGITLAAAYYSREGVDFTFGNAEDFIVSLRMLIEQATGRIGRTPYKSREIMVLADWRLAPYLAGDERPKEELSIEYFELIKKARVCDRSGASKPLIVTPMETAKRKAKQENKKTLDYFDTLVPFMLSNEFYRYATCEGILNDLYKNLQGLDEPSFSVISDLIDNTSHHPSDVFREVIVSHQDWKIITDFNEKIKAAAASGSHKVTPKQVRILLCKKIGKMCGEYQFLARFDEVKGWPRLRQRLLQFPTLPELPGELLHAYVDCGVLKRDSYVIEYSYAGTPEARFADNFEMFNDFTGSVRKVCQEEAEIAVVLKNPVVLDHFRRNGYCTEWKPERFMMCPAAFRNIYRPAVAEQAVTAILTACGLKWEEMPFELTERFDGVVVDELTGQKALIDVKFYKRSRFMKRSHKYKIIETVKKTGLSRIIYVNLFNDTDAECRFKALVKNEETGDLEEEKVPMEASDFMEVPGVLSPDAEILDSHIKAIKKYIRS